MFSNKKTTMQEHFYSCMVGLWLFRLKTPLKACFLQSLSEVLLQRLLFQSFLIDLDFLVP